MSAAGCPFQLTEIQNTTESCTVGSSTKIIILLRCFMFWVKLLYSLIFMFPCIMILYTKMTNKMQLCRIMFYSLAALHVPSDTFAHHQEHLNCITASGITHVCRCQMVSWECWNFSSNTPMIPTGSDIRV